MTILALADDPRRYRSVMNHKRTLDTPKRAVPAVLARACAAITGHHAWSDGRTMVCKGGASACGDGGDGSFWAGQGALMVPYVSLAPGMVRRGRTGRVWRPGAHNHEFVICTCWQFNGVRGTVRRRGCEVGVHTLQARRGEVGAQFERLSDHARASSVERNAEIACVTTNS